MENSENSNTSDNRLASSFEQQPPLFNSPELFGDQNEIMIRHKGEIYKIRITRNNKLIMNK